jgi:hypothetical protein
MCACAADRTSQFVGYEQRTLQRAVTETLIAGLLTFDGGSLLIAAMMPQRSYVVMR